MPGGASTSPEREQRRRSISPSDRALPLSSYRKDIAGESAEQDDKRGEEQRKEEPDGLAEIGHGSRKPSSSANSSPRISTQATTATPLPSSNFVKIKTAARARVLPPTHSHASRYDSVLPETGGRYHQSQPEPGPSSSPGGSWLPPLDVGRPPGGHQTSSNVSLPRLRSWGADGSLPHPVSWGPTRSDSSAVRYPQPLIQQQKQVYSSSPSSALRLQDGVGSSSVLSVLSLADRHIGAATRGPLRRALSTDSGFPGDIRGDHYTQAFGGTPSRSPSIHQATATALSPSRSQHQHYYHPSTTTGSNIDYQHQYRRYSTDQSHPFKPGRDDDDHFKMSTVSSPIQPFSTSAGRVPQSLIIANPQRHHGPSGQMLPPISSLTGSLHGHNIHPIAFQGSSSSSSASSTKVGLNKKRTWEELARRERHEVLRDTLHRFMVCRAEAEAAVLSDASPTSSTSYGRQLLRARAEANNDFFVTVSCSHSGVAQKSYGHEKRFLCPPPIVTLKGPGYSNPLAASEASRHVHLRMNILPLAEGVGLPFSVAGKVMQGGGAGGAVISEDILLDQTLSAKFGHLHVGASTKSAKTFQLQLQLFEPVNSRQYQQPSSSYHSTDSDPRLVKSPRLYNAPDDVAMSRSSSVSRYGPPGAVGSTPSHYYGNENEMMNRRTPPQHRPYAPAIPPQQDIVLDCTSDPITVISKPSKKTTRAKNSSTQITPRLAICLFNRVNSQNVRTRYMAVDHGKLSARNDSWATFYMRPVGTVAVQTSDGDISTREEGTAVTYGSIVVLEVPGIGVVSEEMVVCKVDKGKIIVPSEPGQGSKSSSSPILSTPIMQGQDAGTSEGGPISQMQKVAFMKYEPKIPTDKASLTLSPSHRREEQKRARRLFLCSSPADPWWRPSGANESDFPLPRISTSHSSSSSSSLSPFGMPPRRTSSDVGSQFAEGSHQTQKLPAQESAGAFSSQMEDPVCRDGKEGRGDEPRAEAGSPVESSAFKSGQSATTNVVPSHSPASSSRPAFNVSDCLAPTPLTFLPAGRETGALVVFKGVGGGGGGIGGSRGEASSEGGKNQDVADDAFCWSIVGAASFEYSFSLVGGQDTLDVTDGTVSNSVSRGERPFLRGSPITKPMTSSLSGTLRSLTGEPSYYAEMHCLHLDERDWSAPGQVALWPGTAIWIGSLGPLQSEVVTSASRSVTGFPTSRRGPPFLSVPLPPLPELLRYATSLWGRLAEGRGSGVGMECPPSQKKPAPPSPPSSSSTKTPSHSSAEESTPSPYPTSTLPWLPLLLVAEANGLVCKTRWALELVKISSPSSPSSSMTKERQTDRDSESWSVRVVSEAQM